MTLGFEGWFTLVCLGTMFLLLIKEVAGPDLIVGGTVVVLWLAGVITEVEATRGFASPQVLTVALLFVVAAGLRETGVLRLATGRLLAGAKGPTGALARLLVPTAGFSAFMNNTPLVAMLTPALCSWARLRGVSPSRLLMPISFAAILGGTCTLIGTSTNLLVSGLMEASGLAPLGMFELSVVGIPAAVVGTIYLMTAGRRLLPDRRAPEDELADSREFSVRLRVGARCPFIGKDVESAGLRHLKGLFLIEIHRTGASLVPVRPTDLIREDDELVFVGVARTVVDLLETAGLSAITEEGKAGAPPEAKRVRTIHEVVIPEQSPLVGLNLREARFRRRYDAAVIAIHRGGHRLLEKLGDVRVRAGDTLLVEASAGFRATFAGTGDFLIFGLPTDLGDTRRAPRAITIAVGMVVLMALGLVSTLTAAAAAVLLMLTTGCIQLGRARRAVDLSVVVLLASSFGLAAAVNNSGVAALAAQGMNAAGTLGPLAALAIIYLFVAILTEILSNAAAAAISLPIALALSTHAGCDPRPFCIAVAIAASMSFVTPIGYQTNLLVYGPGGYRFGDFTRVGLPLALLVFGVAMACIPWFWTI
jgi:di/tricarboxylate transporter